MRIQESIYLGVSLVLQFTDEFTGRPIAEAELTVRIPEGDAPLRKPDGYYIFTGLAMEEALVTVESPWYSPRQFFVPVRKEGEPMEVQKIRLCPNAAHPLVKEATCVYGKAGPGWQLAACCPTADHYRKLLLDAKKGADRLALYSREEENLEGSSFFMTEGTGGKGEMVELGPLLERAGRTYQLKAPLKGEHKKIGTRLCVIHRAQADEEGNYFLPLSHGGSGSREYLFWREEKSKKKFDGPKAHTLPEGVRTRLNWEEDL